MRRDLLWLTTGRLITALVALVSVRLSTTLLTPEQYGLLAVLTTFQVFCGLFIVNPVGQYINRYTHAWADDGTLLARLKRYRLYVLLAGLAGAVACGFWSITQPLTALERLLRAAIVMMMVVAVTWNTTSVSLLNMLGRRASSVRWASATVLCGLALSWCLVRLYGGGLAWFAGQACGMAIGAIGAGHCLRRHLPGTKSGSLPLVDGVAIRSYILPLAVATGFMWWQLSGNRLLIEKYWGLAALGSAVVGLSLAGQLWSLFESLAMQFLFPLYYRRIAHVDTNEGSRIFSDLLNTLGPLYLVLAAATLLSASALLAVLVAPEYSHVRVFVQFGAFIECCRVLSSLLGTAAQVNLKMRALIRPYAAGALALTGGMVYAAHSGKNIEIAVTILTMASAVMLLTMAGTMRLALPFKLDWARWGAAATILAVVTPYAWLTPVTPSSFSTVLGVLAGTGIFTLAVFAALLWKNPGAGRLLIVRLSSV